MEKRSGGKNIVTSLKYAFSDALVNQRGYLLGLATILIVVCFVALLQNAVVRSSSIFVRLSETQVGEGDIIFTPDLASLQYDSNSGFPAFWINETLIRNALATSRNFAGTTPRWVLLAKAVHPDTLVNSSVIVLVIDSDRERELGVGRTWQRRPLGWDETYVSSGLLRTLGVKAARGDKIKLQFDLIGQAGGAGLSALDPAVLAQALNASLSSTIEQLNQTLSLLGQANANINVVEVFQTLGLILDPNTCVSLVRLDALPIDTLCTANGALLSDFVPNATVNIQALLDAANITLAPNFTVPGLGNVSVTQLNLTALPLSQVCSLQTGNGLLLGALPLNTTIDASGLANVTCIDGFDLQAVPVSQLNDLLRALTTAQLEAILRPQLSALLQPSFNLTVLEGVDGPDGKWPGALGNVLMLEMIHVPRLLAALLPSNTQFLTQLVTAVGQQGGQVNISGVTGQSLVSSVAVLNTILGGLRSLTPQNMPEYALTVVALLKDRYSVYLQPAEAAAASFVAVTNEVSNRIGFNYSVRPTAPIQEALTGILFIKLFLDQIFGSVMAVLVVLGSMLIYALLLGNVSDKTYEYGMLRALGFERNSLIGLLFVTAFFFTIPGIGLGLLGAWILFVPISLVFQLLTSASSDYALDWSAIVLGVVVGIVMPIVANIGPIRRALSRTLRDSLDVYHNVQEETNVKMVKLKSMGFSPWQIIVAIVMVVMGFLVYYLIPYAFTYNNFALFLGILQVILLSMVLGLCLVATTVQPIMERLVLWCLVWGPDAKLLSLMNKNLSAHRPRNQKTALMFTLSLGFIIFAGASFSLQANTVGDTVKSLIGADANIVAPSWDNPLPEGVIRSTLEAELARNGTLLLGWAFATFPLRGTRQRVSDTRLSNLAGEPNRQIQVYGLDSNHLSVVYADRFFVPSEWDKSVTYSSTTIGSRAFPDVIESLYSSDGKGTVRDEAPPFTIPPSYLALPKTAQENRLDPRNQTQLYEDYVDVVMSEALRYASTVSTTSPLRFMLRIRDGTNEERTVLFLSKARAMCSKVPGFFMSSYRQTATNSPVFVSMKTYQEFTTLVDETFAKTRNARSPEYANVSGIPPKQNCWIRLRPEATTRDVDFVIDQLRNVINDDSIQAINVKGLVEATSVASNAMLIFFNVVAVINSVLSFFLLWLSFDANVRYNGWEVGVLRSLGVNSAQVIRVYVYEAVAVVLTAIMLGTVVGVLVSVVLTLQFNLFLELPFVFFFPVTLFLIVLFLSMLLSVVGAYVPANQFAQRTISNVIKGV